VSKPLQGRTITEVLATSTGGVGTHVRGLAGHLVDAGADLRVVGPQATQDLFDFCAGGARFAPVEIAGGPRPVEDAAAARRRRAATRDSDLIHAHGLRAATVAAAANVGRRTPLVVTLHNAVDTGSAVLRAAFAVLERFVAKSADVVIGASPDLADRARECGARYVLFREVAAPPLPAAARSRARMREELGVPADRPLLLCVGRLHPQKGYDTLVRAAALWKDHPAHPEVLIAGDGPLGDELRRDIDAAGVRIRLLGRRTDVADLLGAADLVLLPSRWEARSLVAQEAMRAGVALVTTTTGGMGELVGDAAYRIPVDDAPALARAVRELLDDPARRAVLAEAGARRAQGFPTEDDTARALTDVYVELLGRGR
jgi:glycosyltransferase involved in cell wall biosynthesis